MAQFLKAIPLPRYFFGAITCVSHMISAESRAVDVPVHYLNCRVDEECIEAPADAVGCGAQGGTNISVHVDNLPLWLSKLVDSGERMPAMQTLSATSGHWTCTNFENRCKAGKCTLIER